MQAMTDESTADDAIVHTGPVPAVELADGHLHVSVRRGVTIANLDGGLDDALARRVAPLLTDLLAEAEAVIVDLDQTTLLDHSALDVLVGVLATVEPGRRCIVTGRLSSRLVLDRWGLPDDLVVFTSVADALQARTFVESGYGTGWSVD